MPKTKGLLLDRQRTPIEWLSFRVSALDLIEYRKVGEGSRDVPVLLTEGFHANGERSPIQRLGLRVVPLRAVEASQIVQRLRYGWMPRAERLLPDGEGPQMKCFCGGDLALTLIERGEVIKTR